MRMTVRELAKQLKISKPAVQNRMNKIAGFREQYTSKVGNRLEINDDGIKLLSASSQHDSYIELDRGLSSKKLDKQVIVTLNEQLKILNHQLEIKDSQISKLQELLDQQQRQQLETVHENHQLQEKINYVSDFLDAHENSTRRNQNANAVETKKKPWWHLVQ